RRHPRLLAATLVTTAVTVLLGVGAGAVLASRTQAEAARLHAEALEAAAARATRHEFEAGTRRTLCLIHTTPGELHRYLRDGVQVCEATLALYQILDRDDWQDQPAVQRLDLAQRQAVAEDARELLLALARARVYLGQNVGNVPNLPERLREALGLLDRAEAGRGLQPSQALWLDRAAYLKHTAHPP